MGNILKFDWSGARIRILCFSAILIFLAMTTFNQNHSIREWLFWVFLIFSLLFLRVQYCAFRTVVTEQYISGISVFGKSVLIFWQDVPVVTDEKTGLKIIEKDKYIYLEKRNYKNFQLARDFILNSIPQGEPQADAEVVAPKPKKTRIHRMIKFISWAVLICWMGYFLIGALNNHIFIPTNPLDWSRGEYLSGYSAWFLLGLIFFSVLYSLFLLKKILLLEKRGHRFAATTLCFIFFLILMLGSRQLPTHTPVNPVVLDQTLTDD